MITSPASSLADEFLDFRLREDFENSLWSGELTHIDAWPDITADGERVRSQSLESFAERAESLPIESPRDRLLAETISFTGRSQAIQVQWSPELRWLDPSMGMLGLIFTFLPRQPLVDDDHGERYLTKIRSFPEFARVWGGRLEAAVEVGIVPSIAQLRSQLAQLDRWLSQPLSTGPLGAQPAPQSFDERHSAIWRAALHNSLDGDMTLALRELVTVFADTLVPAARPDEEPGLLHLGGGSDLYERLVWAHTSLHVSAREVHEIGLAQVERLDDEYRTIAGPLVDTTDLAEIYRRLREDPNLHYSDATTLVNDATRILQKAEAALDGWFGTTPNAPCTATAIEHGALAFYSRPARDGSKAGQFFFNTSDPGMWGTFQLEAVTYHEGIPGHHLQLATALEAPGLHRLLADYYVAAYNEGWGLYTERLADEMGLYSTPLDRVGMLSADSMRACRLVVDTGIHALGWSRQQAIDYLSDNSPMTRLQVEGEIDRYIGNPGQALGYMMGRIAIDGIRSKAESALGDRFDIAAFHDAVLSTGSVPLASLSRVVDEWVDSRS